ncbi:MAG TPA: radical SAM protein [Thermoanaerobaculia bacterium]|jgi:MoaA/NifB/PqqE/SkfB family radical SAM enzyme|nr:radical SAM protein [Thermoanaerobaculia bacterium]
MTILQQEPAAFAPPVGLGQRIVQVHPTLTCNLRCTHCYSGSGPELRGELDLGLLEDALTDAAALGYESVAVSGGEPFAYRSLVPLLEHARGLGLRTLVTTNGTLLDDARAKRLRPLVDVLAISVDGPPEIHNQVRASSRAFEQTERGLAVARAHGFRFGIIHALSKRTWEHLAWLGDFAVEHGAALLQIHPLERVGRAADGMADDAPDDEVLARAWLLAAAIETVHPDLVVQYDVFDREIVLRRPEIVYASEGDAENATAADLLNLLVIEHDGTVVPLTYGISRAFAVCNVKHRRLRQAWPLYQAAAYRDFRAFCKTIWEDVKATPTELPFFDWHELVATSSRRPRP